MKWCQEDLSLLCQNSFGIPQEDFRLYKKYPYIISFCQKNDDLYMWKNYGDAGKGFMLSFNRNVILDHSYKSPQSILLPVSYASSDNKEKIFEDKFMEFQNIFETTNDPFDDVISTCAFVKKDNYVRESEYRYAVLKETNMSFQDGIIKTAEDLSEVKYRTRGNEEILKIPYLDVTFSPEALVEIVFGCRMNQANKETIKSIIADNPNYKINFKQAGMHSNDYRILICDEDDKSFFFK